jgi:hypothetical protein
MTDFTDDAASGAPENAFAADFQSFFAEEEARAAALADDWLIPWSIEELDADEKERWVVFRPGESSAAGDEPAGWFSDKRAAELYANVLFPVAQREHRFTMGLEAGEQGYPIYEKGKSEPVGYMREPDEGWLMRFNIMANMSSSPRAMTWILVYGGGKLAEQVGEINFAKSRWLEKSRRGEE